MSNWVSGLRRLGRAATISCIALAMFSAAAHAQSFNVTNLTNNTSGNASFPNMVVDGNRNTYLAWVDAANHGIAVASQFDGAKFNTEVLIPTAVLPVFQPQIAVRVVSGPLSNVEIVWASLDPASTPSAQVYDVFAARSDDGGATFPGGVFPVSGAAGGSGPVALFDSPRVAFDSTGTTDVVWGRTGVWISQATDGKIFGAATSLLPVAMPPAPPIPPPDTGGPRIAVTSAGHIFVVWTDEASKNAAGSYCIPADQVMDPTGTFFTNTVGGNVWINETVPNPSGPVSISFTNTRNLSATDWNLGPNSPDKRYQVGFYGCSYDNINLYLDHVGLLHFLWADDSPGEDILSSKTITTYPKGSPFAGLTEFSFPFNLASVAAAAPQVAVDSTGNIYVVWSGGPTGGTGATPGSTNSQGIFFSRADAATPITDTGNTFTTAINIAPSNSIAPAFPQIAVDSNSNVNIAWEQPTGALKGDGTDTFNVFFARSTDKGNTFSTVLPVTTNPSTFCFAPAPPPEGDGSKPTTPNFSTCGTVQLGVDANSTPDMAWVNRPSGSAVADIDFATTNFPTGSVSPSAVTLSATSSAQNVTITVSQGGFSGPITFSCFDVDKNSATLPSWLTCTFNPPTLNTAQSTTDTLTLARAGTPTASMFMSAPSSHVLPDSARPMAWSMAIVALFLMCTTMPAMGRRQKLSAAVLTRGLLVMTLTLALGAGLVSCSGGTSSPSTTSTTGTSGSTGTTGGNGGTGGSGGSGGSGGGTGGSTPVVGHIAVMAQTSGAATMNLGTVTVTAQ